MQGIRLLGTDVSPGDEKLMIWRKAADLDLKVSVSGNITPLRKVVDEVSNITVLMEHSGMPKMNGDAIFELASYRNVFVKFTTGGLYGISDEFYPYKDTLPFFKRLCEAFGSRRIMWGSDYPPVQNREGYLKSLDFIRKEVEWLTDNEKDWILGKTALKLWNFR